MHAFRAVDRPRQVQNHHIQKLCASIMLNPVSLYQKIDQVLQLTPSRTQWPAQITQ